MRPIIKNFVRQISLLLCVLVLSSCQPNQRLEPLTLVVGSWYGFYPLYFALEHQLDINNGMKLKILEPTNISNLRRSYLRDQVDMAATSMLEFANATSLSNQALRPVIISDYSNGGDVIIAKKSISNIDELRGKRVAVPSQGIGEYILSLVFNDASPMRFIEQHKIPETECQEAFDNGKIDACVTYPPISTYLLENDSLHVLYSTESHPGRVFDIIWAKPSVQEKTLKKVETIWFSAVEKINRNPQAFYEFVARIANVPEQSVQQAMQGIQIIDQKQHQSLLSTPQSVASDLVQACYVARAQNCEAFHQLFLGND